MNSNINLGRYGCPVCTERFTSLPEKKSHIRAEHPHAKKAP